MNQSLIPLVSVVFYMLAFAAGFGGTMPVYVAEVVPAIGVGISTALQWASTFAVGYFVPKLVSIIHIQGFLYIFIACNIFAFFFVMITCIETKGLTETEIAKLYAKKAGLPEE